MTLAMTEMLNLFPEPMRMTPTSATFQIDSAKRLRNLRRELERTTPSPRKTESLRSDRVELKTTQSSRNS